MPNVLQREQVQQVEFVASPALDLLNCMYFTYLAGQVEGVDDWPVRTRAQMAPALRDELDLLFTYPSHQPGVMGALNDALFFHRGAWGGVDNLLRFLRDLPGDGTHDPERPGIRGLALYALGWCGHERFSLAPGADPREAFAQAIEAAPPEDLPIIPSEPVRGGREAVLAMYDDAESVRSRMLALIRRFYDEHYRVDEERRRRCLERSVARNRVADLGDIDALLRRVTGRQISCIQDEPANYTKFIFVPSVDVGPYNSCADIPPVHGLHYPCEPETADSVPGDGTDTVRMAQVYRALSDEQRLRILGVLSGGELYAQEIVARTGLHQSVVSRNLAFLKAVGLVNVRRQNNMKFFSLNTAMRDQLRQAMDSLLPASSGGNS